MVGVATDYTFDADRVKRIRVQLGMSQEQFARKLGVTTNTVSRWEKDSKPRAGRVLKALLDAESELA